MSEALLWYFGALCVSFATGYCTGLLVKATERLAESASSG